MRNGFVQIEDGPVFPAMIEEGGWNGWAVPYFSRETARDVLKAYAVAYDASWHADTLVMWDSCDDPDRERVIVETVSVGGETFYGIGAGSWIWSEAETTDPRTCNACGDYFDTLTDYEAHDCADTMGE